MDGTQFHQITGSRINNQAVWNSLCHSPMYFLLNVAVGGSWVSGPLFSAALRFHTNIIPARLSRRYHPGRLREHDGSRLCCALHAAVRSLSRNMHHFRTPFVSFDSLYLHLFWATCSLSERVCSCTYLDAYDTYLYLYTCYHNPFVTQSPV
jgi:hypothetical protein